MTRATLAGCVFALVFAPFAARSEQVLVAVAANFAEVARALESEFERNGEHSIDLVIGSTGKLYAQIMNGAPFDVLLAADQERPRRLEEARLSMAGSRRTYAIGRLVLWSPDPQRLAGDGVAVLRGGEFRSLAIANPRLAPYGAAAAAALQALGAYGELRSRIVMGENVGQAHAMVASGNAELGLIALSSVRRPGSAALGSIWELPADLYSPIRQDAVLLARAMDNIAARAFLDFLAGAFAIQLIERYGYRVE